MKDGMVPFEFQTVTHAEDPTECRCIDKFVKMLTTLYCFFTSQVGATKVLRYVSIPGKYDGALPYKKGDKAWAT